LEKIYKTPDQEFNDLNNSDNSDKSVENDIKTNLEKLCETRDELKEGLLDYSNLSRLNKKYTRTNNTSYTEEKVNVTRTINNYFISHYTPADLSLLSDFEDFKFELDIVNKSFVTLKKPLLIQGMNVIIRDTILIAPGGKKSLDAISQLYNGLRKVKIEDNQINNMKLFQREDPEMFKKYALQDSLITLVHGLYVENVYHTINGLGIPVTLSSISSSYLRKF
jgi:hypothetical protein